MSLGKGTEDLSNTGSVLNCGVCTNEISSTSYLYKSNCGHPFHKSCYQKLVKTKQVCPICSAKLSAFGTTALPGNRLSIPPPIKTRSQTQRAQEVDLNKCSDLPGTPKSAVMKNLETNARMMSSSSPEDQRDHIKNLVTAAVKAQQAEMLSSLSQQLVKIIETNMEAGFRRLSLGHTRKDENELDRNLVSNNGVQSLPVAEQQTLDQLLGLPSNTDNTQSCLSSGVRNLDYSGGNSLQPDNAFFRPDKVGHIIHNWKIRFTGDPNGMSVDNFIYRVEALTAQTLNGNFELLCRHISTLFESKATDWFWRYHRSVNEIKWPDLCTALRHQYKDSRTDVDLREMIRDRKQKPGETFDSFYEAVVDIADRLSSPLPEKVLVEILRRNLLSEIQHEILNLTVYSVSHLRDICRRREFFMMDLGKRQHLSKPIIARRQVHEILDAEPESEEEDEISAISLVCWNCRKSGHRYHDCLEDRTVFCYGCGEPKVYKPNCTKCSGSKNLRGSAPKSALKQTKSTNPSAE